MSSDRLRTPLYGRVVFGASAVLFGIIALMWRDADTWQTLRSIWKLPFGLIIGACLMAALIAGGIGIQFSRAARPASIILVIVYVLFTLACIPDIVAAPGMYLPYGNFFYQLSLVCGAIAVYALSQHTAAHGKTAQAMAFARAALIGLGLCAISFTLSQIFYFRFTAALVPTWIPPSRTFWAVLTTVAFALAAIAILSNRQAWLATRLLTVMLALFGVLVWIPRLIAHPQSHGDWSEFALTFLTAGAAWAVADLKSF